MAIVDKFLLRNIITVVLFLACLFTGYGFYKMFPTDVIPAIAFTIGISGIVLSLLREQKNGDTK